MVLSFPLYSHQALALILCQNFTTDHDGYITGPSMGVWDIYTSNDVQRQQSLNIDNRAYLRFLGTYPYVPAVANLTITQEDALGMGGVCPSLYKINDYYAELPTGIFNAADYSHASDEIQITTLSPCDTPFRRFEIDVKSYINPKVPNAFMIRYPGPVDATHFVDVGYYSKREATISRRPNLLLCGDSPIPSTGPRLVFNSTSAGNMLSRIGNNGHMNLVGKVYPKYAALPSTGKDFVIKNTAGTPVIVLKNTVDITAGLYLKGNLYQYQSQATLSSFLGGASDLIVRNSTGNLIVVFTANGDVYVSGRFQEGFI